MTELTRRTLLTGTAAATAVAALPLTTGRPAHAAAPPAGTQAPGWYRYKVGSFEITVVTDGVNRFKLPDNLVSNAKREDVIAALAAARLPSDIFVTPYNPRRQYRTEARGHRHRPGRGRLRCDQGGERSVLDQSRRRRHRRQGGRHRHHLALPRRPRERPVEGGQFARFSQCRDSGAGGRTQVLDG